jgi:hypothetical protein
MKTPDAITAVPAPTTEDKPFDIGDELTVYEAAMVYAGRHPYPQMFGPYDRSSKREHCLTLLKLGLSARLPRRQRAQRSWDIFCELGERVKRGQITPIRSAHDPASKIDLIRTVISTADLVQLAKDRDEQPRYLRPLLEAAEARAAKPDADCERRATDHVKELLKANHKMTREDARQACEEKFPELHGRVNALRRIWRNARDALGLGRAWSPGRPKKINQITSKVF